MFLPPAASAGQPGVYCPESVNAAARRIYVPRAGGLPRCNGRSLRRLFKRSDLTFSLPITMSFTRSPSSRAGGVFSRSGMASGSVHTGLGPRCRTGGADSSSGIYRDEVHRMTRLAALLCRVRRPQVALGCRTFQKRTT